MSKPKKTTTSYQVLVNLNLDIGISIEADSLGDAVVKAEALTVGDLVDFRELGWDHNDSSMKITGAFS